MPDTVPEYRLRLFLSADLVGSTAFKTNKQNQEFEKAVPRPIWVRVFSEFYIEFSSLVQTEFRKGSGNLDQAEREEHPKIWKTIGDEIILCCRLLSIEHTAYCVACFLKCLEQYHDRLNEHNLGIKGNAWIAAFPAPNVSLKLIQDAGADTGELSTSEEIESKADTSPHEFDFLGKAIDTGFRIARNSTYDHTTLSVQLAFILVKAKKKALFAYDLEFRGRETLKGVNDGIPYPIIAIDTEICSDKKSLIDKEKTLTGQKTPSEDELLMFLEKFMKVAGVEQPYIGFREDKLKEIEVPETHKTFVQAYEAALTEVKNRNENIEGAAEDDPQSGSATSGKDFAELIKALGNLIGDVDIGKE